MNPGWTLRTLFFRPLSWTGPSWASTTWRSSAKASVSPPWAGSETDAFALLRQVVDAQDGPVQLSGLKNKVRKVQPGFTEKTFGYGGFLQFAKADATQGVVTLDWDDEADDYLLTVPA